MQKKKSVFKFSGIYLIRLTLSVLPAVLLVSVPAALLLTYRHYASQCIYTGTMPSSQFPQYIQTDSTDRHLILPIIMLSLFIIRIYDIITIMFNIKLDYKHNISFVICEELPMYKICVVEDEIRIQKELKLLLENINC